MNDRKQHVVKMAHELFINKGFQATSIQDILDYSGISKGTFYNYFSSKNELLMAIFKTIYKDLEKKRNELLIGQDRSDIEIFIKQIEMQLMTNRKNRLIPLFEEVMVSKDTELKKFLEQGKLRNIQWIYHRLIDIFGESKKPYLLDCAIMFMGILRENIKFNRLYNESSANISRIVRYSVNRLVNMVADLSENKEQLLQPELVESWFPNCKKQHHDLNKKIHNIIFLLKNNIGSDKNHMKAKELLEFIEEELFGTKSPRKFLIGSAILSLKTEHEDEWGKDLSQLEQLLEEYFKLIKD
ncbi:MULTISPECIES: TetR/AcrR family transcriptional regulator [Neobacillus]|jgi:AcrR family transcriptional regulator|uniref:TetR/AcrR family transcriptional regulator n=1 Tax=Neobacillus TaxID=2675232 RepID=UPI0004F77445|nr:TetR/AcrR family transcriptional regulator [Neobacillus sedimentimangrovi]AIM15084.1 TetR family transcriptional regulator [Bacillus sp. X1(2014)]